MPTVTYIKAIDQIVVVDIVTISKEATSIDNKRKSSYTKWNEKDRYSIGSYASENGVTTAARKFESPQRLFRKKVEAELKKSAERDSNKTCEIFVNYGMPLVAWTT